MGYLKRVGIIAHGQPVMSFNQFVLMVSQMNKGLHPIYDEKTGKMTYRGRLEF
jgi:hypothetical protein